VTRTAFLQVYDVARTLTRPRRPAEVRVTILGDSRIWFTARPAYVERELRRITPDLDVRVDNLAIFGAKIGDMEILARQIGVLDPMLVVVALDGSNLIPEPGAALVNATGAMLETGWRDGPLPPPGRLARLRRGLRTIWPLYRFRLFVREAIVDWVHPSAADEKFPDAFDSRDAVFEFFYRGQAGRVEAAYQGWLRERTLDRFVSYLRRSAPGRKRRLVPRGATLAADSPGVQVLDALLTRTAARGFPTIVLILPENPVLELDEAGEYHDPGFSEQAAGVIEMVARKRGVRFVDARRWMPAESFFDFLHAFPDAGGFQVPFARMIVDASGG